MPIGNSIQDAEKALRYDPGNVQVLVLLGDLHRFRASLHTDNETRKDERQKALDAYQQALRADGPDDLIEARIAEQRDLMQQNAAAH